MIAKDSELREKICYGSIKDWILPSLVSLGINAFGLGVMNYSFAHDNQVRNNYSPVSVLLKSLLV